MNEAEFAAECARLQQDRSHGASALARQALKLLERSASGLSVHEPLRFYSVLEQRCNQLKLVRPSMAVIGVQVMRWQAELHSLSNSGGTSAAPPLAPAQATEHMSRHTTRMLDESRRACALAAQHMAARIRPGQTIITLSSSSTLNAVFARLSTGIDIIVAESRPLNEGVEVARNLLRRGFDVTLITEAQMGVFVPRADMALIGADTVLADGSVVNKSGSYLLALAAHAAGVKVYCCHESYKNCGLKADELEIEAMDVAELGHPDIPAAAQRNVYFDCTPPHLISAHVTEHGVAG